jgi:hypothetical protein
MAQHYATWPVAVLCEGIEVSHSGFYAYGQRHAVPRIDRDAVALLARVKAIQAETTQSDGSRRRAKQLRADGCAVGRSTARRGRHPAPAAAALGGAPPSLRSRESIRVSGVSTTSGRCRQALSHESAGGMS